MSNKTKQNSIIFLTTLSVYLGLVLVGGVPPSVFAQAATTRNFNVQDEIEVKDDLDKKPDDEIQNLLGKLDKGYFTIDNYIGEIETLLFNLKRLNLIEKFDLEDAFQVDKTSSMPCFVDGDPVGIGTEKLNVHYNKWLTSALTDAANNLQHYTEFLEDCLPSKRFGDSKERNSTIILSFDSSELKIGISGFKESPQKAKQLAENLNQVFTIKIRENANKPEIKQFYENTKSSSENNQVFIVTRLPRGSLDALLVNDTQ